MQEEIDVLQHNNTWNLVPRPCNTNIIGSKWVYRIKYHEDGTNERFKAQILVKGFTQVPSVDYIETFILVIKPTTIRLILSLIVTSN